MCARDIDRWCGTIWISIDSLDWIRLIKVCRIACGPPIKDAGRVQYERSTGARAVGVYYRSGQDKVRSINSCYCWFLLSAPINRGLGCLIKWLRSWFTGWVVPACGRGWTRHLVVDESCVFQSWASVKVAGFLSAVKSTWLFPGRR